MEFPGYQDFMLPLLQLTGDKQEHRLRDATHALGDQFNLSDAQRAELLPSGEQTKLHNRVQWASTYLKKSGLIESPARGRFRITDLGLSILGENPKVIDNRFLKRFPGFVEFTKKRPSDEVVDPPEVEPPETPEEVLGRAMQTLRKTLASDLLERVRRGTPAFFEQMVIDLLVAMGYGGSRQDAGQAVGRSGDGGIDGIIKEDRLGLDAVYVQAKRWDATVGRPVVQAFAGSLEGHRAKKGLLISTSEFSAEARDYIQRIEKRIVLIDGQQLTQLMIDHNVGVTIVNTYSVKKLDGDYFEEVE